MDREEYCKDGRKYNIYYKLVHNFLRKWKVANNIQTNVRYDIHHRDDTDETRDYNDNHYELWGCNEDGTFEYGKYVIFMTHADHTLYHKKGKNLSEETKVKMSEAHRGKTFSEEHKQKMSENSAHYWKDKKRSEETRQKMSEAKQVAGDFWKLYKQLHPESTMTYHEFRKTLNTHREVDKINL